MTARDMRLPGSVAEIKASPPGPKIGAFFDLDGTLVAGFTGVILTQQQIRSREMGVGAMIGMIQAGLNHQLGRLEFEGLIHTASRVMKGRALSDLDELGERLFTQKIQGRIYPEMRDLVRAHLERGHTVCLSSSALTIQVEPVAKYLGIPNTLTNKFEVDDDGLLTGNVIKPILWGPGKADAVQGFAAEHGIDLKDSYFYADGDEDVALMYLVGNPRPTNPEGKMAAIANRRGWPILRFSSRSGTGITGPLRTLAGIGTMFPVAAGAVGWGLLTRNRRRGVNFFTSNWSQLLLIASGVSINVIGEKNLTVQRPAVFLFNHRNNFDPFITGSLIKDNFTSVGKKELENDPLVGTIGRVMDAAFIDRDDPKAAVEGLRKIEELAKKGISVMIAPEGTRMDTVEVGPFKKGPFRIAMAAGVPIIPIVLRNAEVIASKDATAMNPGTVDVAVFPPISTDDWTPENLTERIAVVRQLYLDTLKDWPVDGQLPTAELYGNPAAKKAPAKKAPAKKAPAKKAPAKKAPVKKAAKKVAAKKVPAKKAEAPKKPLRGRL
jgi:putative phosphoserine phosphatase/1-acylglycerol-3-phosphate O-acyltransferase